MFNNFNNKFKYHKNSLVFSVSALYITVHGVTSLFHTDAYDNIQTIEKLEKRLDNQNPSRKYYILNKKKQIYKEQAKRREKLGSFFYHFLTCPLKLDTNTRVIAYLNKELSKYECDVEDDNHKFLWFP